MKLNINEYNKSSALTHLRDDSIYILQFIFSEMATVQTQYHVFWHKRVLQFKCRSKFFFWIYIYIFIFIFGYYSFGGTGYITFISCKEFWLFLQDFDSYEVYFTVMCYSHFFGSGSIFWGKNIAGHKVAGIGCCYTARITNTINQSPL